MKYHQRPGSLLDGIQSSPEGQARTCNHFERWRGPGVTPWQARRTGRSRFVFWVGGALIGLAQQSCFVAEKCYADKDCSLPDVCNRDGECVFECSRDAHCDARYGADHVCASHRCIESPACTSCSFPHADHLCVHGRCEILGCQPGFHDLNGEPADGCEYACVPADDGVEQCNDRDDDCDGASDETFDLGGDVAHCGACFHTCAVPPNAEAVCSSGQCTYRCQVGWFDNDGITVNGCEAAECIPAEEICDGRDNDCDCPGDTNQDGVTCGPEDQGVDEGFAKDQLASCGPFCVSCAFDHGEAECVAGACVLVGCREHYHDLDGKSANGCEYGCVPTGDEVCDSRDNDCDGQVDEGEVCGAACPEDMVSVGEYCVDRYEASRPDATAIHPGTDESRATSRSGVLPWMVNPMTSTHFASFQAACAAVGKRLCSKAEWVAACIGPEGSTYVYGNTFNRETCNCVDSLCDDYCVEVGLDTCNTGEDCGYDYDCYSEMPTGSFPGCTNAYGTLDINGNAWEIVPSDTDVRGFEVRGGAFNCAGARQRVSCGYNATWGDLHAGFRCCRNAQH